MGVDRKKIPTAKKAIAEALMKGEGINLLTPAGIDRLNSYIQILKDPKKLKTYPFFSSPVPQVRSKRIQMMRDL
jgi:hypothetical protein